MVSDPNVSKKGEKRRQRNISILPWISARFSRMSMCKLNNDIRRPGGEIIQHTDADIENAFQPEMRLFNIYAQKVCRPSIAVLYLRRSVLIVK